MDRVFSIADSREYGRPSQILELDHGFKGPPPLRLR